MALVIRVGVQVAAQDATYAQMRAAWRRADELGADTLFTWDHLIPPHADRGESHFECWTLLAAMAEVTERVELGALVSAASYRNPHLLADMARTIDHVSGGRFILGIGAGWFEPDYREYGFEFGTVASRLRDLEVSLRAIEHRLQRLKPPPLRRMPLLVGGSGERVTLRIVAQHADIWNCISPNPPAFARKNACLDGWCSRIGRDPAAIERCSLIRPDDVSIADAFLEAGATHLVVSSAGPEYDMRPLEWLVAWRERQGV